MHYRAKRLLNKSKQDSCRGVLFWLCFCLFLPELLCRDEEMGSNGHALTRPRSCFYPPDPQPLKGVALKGAGGLGGAETYPSAVEEPMRMGSGGAGGGGDGGGLLGFFPCASTKTKNASHGIFRKFVIFARFGPKGYCL